MSDLFLCLVLSVATSALAAKPASASMPLPANKSSIVGFFQVTKMNLRLQTLFAFPFLIPHHSNTRPPSKSNLKDSQGKDIAKGIVKGHV